MFLYGRNHSRTLGVAGGLAAFTSLLLSGSTLAAGGTNPPSNAEILWDQFGIPHIYGPDLLTVVRGLGYAEMENHAETILMNVASARGRSAEYFGPGAGNANFQNDFTVRTEDIPNRAHRWLDTGGAEQAAIIQAFTDGVNEYANRHGDTIDPSFQRVLPFVPTDVTAGIQNVVHFHLMPEQDNLPDLIAAWQAGGISAANAVACSFTPGCPKGTAVAHSGTLGGSNGWAIAPKKSASGNAILMGNPHTPWGNNSPIPPIDGLGIYQWMEVNLVIGDPEHPKLNATGVVFAGAPFIGIGYSDEIGWTHTDNTIQNTNLYELTLNRNGTYNFGGKAAPLAQRTDVIKIRQADGSLVSRNIYILTSVQGPIIAQSTDGTKALALRVAGLDQPSAVTQYWGMIRAHNLDEFIDANSALQMPYFNVIYADRDGHILYLFGGRQPVREGGDWGNYSGILDGSDPSLVWKSTFTWSELPNAIDPPGGFVANSNNPPWTSTFPTTSTNDPAQFPAYVAPQFMDLRPQHGARFLLSNESLTPTLVLKGKESTRMVLADRVLPDLINAAQASGNPIAQAAAATLAAWDRNADATSQGAVLFEAWWSLITSQTPPSSIPSQCLPLPAVALDNTINYYSAHPQFRVGWNPNDPLKTPYGLANAAATIPYLICAAEIVQAVYGALNVPWGAVPNGVHNVVLATHDPTFQTVKPLTDAPQSGADDPFGVLRVLFRYPEPDGIHFFPVSGDGYVQLVEFTQGGANAQALLGYGNASRPGSTHITDQLSYFEAKTLRPVYRTRADVNMHTVSQEVVY
jgi:acyl-homoserine-lactone acylase